MRLILTVLCLIPALAAATSRDSVTTGKLPNGLEIVVIEDHRAPVVTHMLWYKTGSADEPPGVSGVAHFLEHLLFKGTEAFPGDTFQRVIAENGGTDNAFTSFDNTAYFQRVAADRLDLMMEMEADRMRNLTLTDEDIQTELAVVLEERNTRVDNNPGAIFGEQRRAALFLNHPYGRPIIGWKHEMLSLDREAAIGFYETYYAPNNAILIVAGDVTPEQVFELAETYYGPLQPSDNLPERVRPTEPPQLAERRMIFRDARVRQPVFYRSYIAPVREPGDQAQAAALAVLADLLGGGITSHLAQQLQFEEKVAVTAGAGYSGTAYDPQSFGLYAAPVPGVALEVLEARLDAAVAAFIAEGPDPEELERIKAQIRASEIYALDSQTGRANAYGSALTAGLTVEDVVSWPDALKDVTVEDVVAAAELVFDRRASVTGYMLGEAEDAE